MGKNLITQRRGRGGSTYRSPSHRHAGRVRHPGVTGEGVVTEIFHAPGHTAPLARISVEGQEAIMVAPDGLQVDQKVFLGGHEIDRGHTLPVGQIPEGTLVYNVEARPGDGGRFARAAGTAALVVSQGEKTVVQLPSGKFKEFHSMCRATIGVIAGAGRPDKPFFKAGKKIHAFRSFSKAPFKVRGVAKNPVDHPHGGGAHQHVGRPSTVPSSAPPGRKVGRLSPKRKRRNE